MFTRVSTFLGSMTLPSLDIVKPRMVRKNTMNAHLFGFKPIPNFLHLKKHFLIFSRWVDRSLKIENAPRNIFFLALLCFKCCFFLNKFFNLFFYRCFTFLFHRSFGSWSWVLRITLQTCSSKSSWKNSFPLSLFTGCCNFFHRSWFRSLL